MLRLRVDPHRPLRSRAAPHRSTTLARYTKEPHVDAAPGLHRHARITTRTEPSLPLASLRAQNQLSEVDGSALRFDLQETQTFLARENFGTLALSEVKLLHGKTEGWPAALRIVACTSQSGQDLGRYVRSLSGTQRPIGAYLAEMLGGLPGEMVLFMLRTAILDRLSAPSCEAVTEARWSHEMLASIETRQLLLTRLDQEGRWYRYHPLLAEYLNDRLQSAVDTRRSVLGRYRAQLFKPS